MILNENYLRKYSSEKISRNFNEYFQELKKAPIKESYDIFISHSSLDKELSCALYDIFTNDGFKVYLDTEDIKLNPETVSSDTGKRLREILKKCKCLAYVYTPNIFKSKWCPWELGLFDGISNGKCCILPVLYNDNNLFKGEEFLGMYPYLSREKTEKEHKDIFWVNDQNDERKYTSFKSWIDGNDLILHKNTD